MSHHAVFFSSRSLTKTLQVKSRGFEEMSALEDAEKPVNNVEDKSLPVDEEKLATGTHCPLPA